MFGGVAQAPETPGKNPDNVPMAIEIHSKVVDTPPLPSATVMVLRPSARAMEVLLMRRHADSGVLGGVHVFPGGKLDAADMAISPALCDASADQCRVRLNEASLSDGMALGLHAAAMRETFEECGLVLGAPGHESAHAARRLRGLIGEGVEFSGALQALGWPMAASSLLPWSRWVTPRVTSMTLKRFDTRFFVALAPEGQAAEHCERETTEAVWLDPTAALERAWRGEIDLAPPQIMSLALLARLGTIAEVKAWAASHAPALIEPEPMDVNGERVICYPGDAEHSVSEAPWPGPTRLVFRQGRFEAPGGLAALLG